MMLDLDYNITPADLLAKTIEIASNYSHVVYKKHRYRLTDRVIEKPFYVWEDEPDCLIGNALFELGIPVEVLQEFDDYSDAGIADLFSIDNDDTRHLRYIQDGQDTGYSWGQVIGANLSNIK